MRADQASQPHHRPVHEPGFRSGGRQRGAQRFVRTNRQQRGPTRRAITFGHEEREPGLGVRPGHEAAAVEKPGLNLDRFPDPDGIVQ